MTSWHQKLLLTSQGLPLELKNVFLSSLNKSPSDSRVAFITTAAYGEEKNPTWLNHYRKQLNGYGIKDIEDLDLKGKTAEKLEKIFRNKNIIFINGGNTFYLLHWVRKSGFDNIIRDQLNQGKLYVGVSAGSYIACPTIEQSTWGKHDRNKIGLKDLTGLNLVSFLIRAHFVEEDRQLIEEVEKTVKYPIVALNDTQAILVNDHKYKLVGKGKKEFFNGFMET